MKKMARPICRPTLNCRLVRGDCCEVIVPKESLHVFCLVNTSQCLWLAAEVIPLFLGSGEPLLQIANAEEEDISLLEADTLLLRTILQHIYRDAIRLPWIVWKRVSRSRVVLHDIQEDTTTNDTMLGPVVNAILDGLRVYIIGPLQKQLAARNGLGTSVSVEHAVLKETKVSQPIPL